MAYFVVNEKCTGCLACVVNCPAGALAYEDRGDMRVILHSMSACARCGNCWRICPVQAVEFRYLMLDKWEEVKSLELIHCEVCGAPVYTERLKEALQSDKRELLHLCDRHRTRRVAALKAGIPSR